MSDAKGYFECQQDKEAKKGFMTVPSSVEDAKKEVKKIISQYRKKKPENEQFVIEINNEFAGYVSIDDLNEKHFEHRAGIGYAIHPNFRGKGITTKAVKLVTNYAFKKHNLKHIVSCVELSIKHQQGFLKKQDIS